MRMMGLGGSCLTHLLRHAAPAYFFSSFGCDPSCPSIRTSEIPYLFMYLRIHASAWLSVTDLFSLTSKTANRTPLLLATDFMCDLNVFSDFDVYTVLISMPVDRSARLTVVFSLRVLALQVHLVFPELGLVAQCRQLLCGSPLSGVYPPPLYLVAPHRIVRERYALMLAARVPGRVA